MTLSFKALPETTGQPRRRAAPVGLVSSERQQTARLLRMPRIQSRKMARCAFMDAS